MNRRRFLQWVGGVGTVSTVAGCSRFTGTDSGESGGGRVDACRPYEPTVSGSSDWPTVGGDPAGTGVAPASAAPEPPLSLDWTFTLGGNTGSTRPVATAERVYAHALESPVYAVDAASGEEEWTADIDDPRGSLAIGDDVVVVIGSTAVSGLNPATGETLWTGPTDGAGYFHGSPVVVDDTVYVPYGLSLFALDVANGTVRWQHTTGEETVGTPAVVGDTVFYGDRDTYVYAIDTATGDERWRVKTDAHVECNVAVADGTVFAATREGIVHAIEAATGNHAWSYDVRSEPNVVATDGAHTYVATNTRLHALDVVTGASCWSTDAYQGNYDSGVAVAGGRVYVPLDGWSQYGGLLGMLDAATGETLGQTRDEFASSYARFAQGPAVVDGAVFATGVGESGIGLARLS